MVFRSWSLSDVAAVCVEPSAALPAEPLRGDHASQQGRRTVFVVAEVVVQRLENIEADIEPDEIGEGRWTHGMRQTELHDLVDRFLWSASLLERENRLVDHRKRNAVGDEAG